MHIDGLPPSAMITRSRSGSGQSTFIGRRRGVWFMVDLGERVRVKVTHYSLEHMSSGFGLMRGWNLEGSHDGDHWDIIKQHDQDDTLQYNNMVATWAVDDCLEYYRYFKIQLTQRQHHGWWEITAGLLEIYGYFMDVIC